MSVSERAVALPLTGLLMVELGSSVAAPFGAPLMSIMLDRVSESHT